MQGVFILLPSLTVMNCLHAAAAIMKWQDLHHRISTLYFSAFALQEIACDAMHRSFSCSYCIARQLVHCNCTASISLAAIAFQETEMGAINFIVSVALTCIILLLQLLHCTATSAFRLHCSWWQHLDLPQDNLYFSCSFCITIKQSNCNLCFASTAWQNLGLSHDTLHLFCSHSITLK